ncbi:MAG: hypothetical protein V4671_07880 [Armatimonadota bacterium]
MHTSTRRDSQTNFSSRFGGSALLPAAVACLLLPTGALAAPPLTVLTVGGGPTYGMNQVAIESNVRYVTSLLPGSVGQTLLFTNGDPKDTSVQFADDGPPLSKEEEAFRLLFRQSPDTTRIRYRAPQIPKIAGPSQHASFNSAMTSLAAPSAAANPLMLYFTGHGSPDKGNHENNNYDLWNEPGLTVQELSAEVAKLPKERPVTLIMVQCFSGSFGNLLFQGGDAAGDLVDRPLCGFFATTKDRVAAGCTPELNEKNYRDFTSFFFAALTGRDRLGGKVAPPDYNKDGKVGMDEAFCYSILTSPSIDVPVATSDVFLRRFVSASDEILTKTSFDHVLSVASPAQRAALDGLSRSLGDDSPDRLKNALGVVMGEQTRTSSPRPPQPAAPRNESGTSAAPAALPPAQATLARWRKRLEDQFSGLGNGFANPQFSQARDNALEYLKANPAIQQEILGARDSMIQQMRGGRRPRTGTPTSPVAAAERASRGVLSLRLARLAKSVLLEEQLRASGDTTRIAQFDRLKKLESGNPFTAL